MSRTFFDRDGALVNGYVLKAAIDRQVNAAVGRRSGQRHDFSRAELDQIDQTFAAIVAAAVSEVFNATD